MADPFADNSDVSARWRPLTTDEQATADVLCSDASAIIRARFPGIDSQVIGGSVDADTVTMVVAGMVKRAMLGGANGVTSDTTTVGPFTQGQTFANPLGNVFLTAADLVLILGYQPPGQSRQYGNTTTKRGGTGDFVNLTYETLTVLGP